MKSDDKRFFAWLDGELSGAEAAEMETCVAADPHLAHLAEQHRALHARLKKAFDPLAEAPVPPHLLAAARKPQAELIDFVAAKRSREDRRWAPLPQWTAMAATLAIGILVGTMVMQRGSAPVEAEGGKLYAAAALDQTLDEQLASAPANAGVRIGVTFRNQNGVICRSFTNREASGLACRVDGRWQVRGLFAAPEGQASDYRMVAGLDPNLAAIVDSTIAGEPFDAAQEKTARNNGWR